MKIFLIILFLGAVTAAPQLSQFKDLLNDLAGDDEPGEVDGDYEQVPYTVIQKYDVVCLKLPLLFANYLILGL